jgi:tRNA (guanine37-N1)-methyltransferase
MSWRATTISLFPEMFRALEDGIWTMDARQLRDHATGRHRNVDDAPFGGGAGMVLRADVIEAAVAEVADDRPVVVLTPRGVPLTQQRVAALARGPGVILLCGRFEGIDQRVIEARQMTEISIGDYVLSGGETAALVLLDACIRLLPGVMGAVESGVEESFSAGLLEYPHYTRPAEWCGRAVPEVLLSGNHAAIAAWRLEQARAITRQRRPELWAEYLSTNTVLQTKGSAS